MSPRPARVRASIRSIKVVRDLPPLGREHAERDECAKEEACEERQCRPRVKVFREQLALNRPRSSGSVERRAEEPVSRIGDGRNGGRGLVDI